LINIDAATWIPTTLSRYHQTKMNIVCGDGFWSSEVYSMIVYLICLAVVVFQAKVTYLLSDVAYIWLS